jgi:TonB family protein
LHFPAVVIDYGDIAGGAIFPMRPFLRIMVGSAALLGSTSGGAGAQPKLSPARVIDEPTWSYPLKAQRAGVRQGEARALLSISDEGELLDFLVVGCTHIAFAEEVAGALPKIRFAPAKLRGEPTTVRMPVSFYFQQEGTIASLSPLEQWDSQLNRLGRDHEEFTSWVCRPRELDRPLTPVKVVSPVYPEELRSRRETAVVDIDFYVDGTGRVRLPAVEAGTHPSFTREAVAALTTWTFEPPTSYGQPVIVRATQRFRFSPPEEKAPAK